MKIYTFKAPTDTRVEILWSLRNQNRDKIFNNFVQKTSWQEVDRIQNCDVAIYPHKAFNPETLCLNNSIYGAVVQAEKYYKPLVLDATCDSDAFLNIPTARILRCGLYKSLKKSFETECPFWSNHRTKKNLENLSVKSKQSKPIIGFCGTASSVGKLSQIGKHLLPTKVAQKYLAQGRLARKIDVRIVEGMSLKLRSSAIETLAADKRVVSHFDISNPHQSYYLNDDNNRIKLENLFINNMDKCDYSLCIRGSGNYSGRLYMALCAGRIPIVLDTDIIIPHEEKLNIVKVPIKSLNKIGDFVLEHFENNTDQEIKEMKQQNRLVYNQFLAPEKFFTDFLENIVDSYIKPLSFKTITKAS